MEPAAPTRHPRLCYSLTGSDSLAVAGLLVGAVPRWFLDREQDRAQQMGAAVRGGLT